MQPARVVLWIAGLMFIGFGVAFTLWPLPAARVVEIPLPTPTARIDFAATYGGFSLGFGAFLIMCARRTAWLQPGLIAVATALAGLGLVRTLGILAAAGPPLPIIFIGLGVELTGVAVSLLALRHLRVGAHPRQGAAAG
ncbi:MAG TPA: DUF4345 domain-containing protein [Gemmatimonadales bacterium]|nr:DUF4345 domain-containing protein [Gemmatimonadales bacterium]